MSERFLQVVSVGFMIFFIGSAWAETEDGGHHGMHRGMTHGGPDMERMVEHMSQRLELDEAQELAIRNIVGAAKPEAQALHEQERSNREAMHALDLSDADYDVKLQNLAVRNGELVTQMTLLHGRVMAEVSAELTDDQRARMSEGRDEMRKHFRHRRRSKESVEDTTT